MREFFQAAHPKAEINILNLCLSRFYEEREFGSCCYGFAMAFINHIRTLEGNSTLSREEFTGTHILPRIKTVSKYIRVYQEISQNTFYIADQNESLKTEHSWGMPLTCIRIIDHSKPGCDLKWQPIMYIYPKLQNNCANTPSSLNFLH